MLNEVNTEDLHQISDNPHAKREEEIKVLLKSWDLESVSKHYILSGVGNIVYARYRFK